MNPPCASVAAALGLTPGAQNGDVISIGPGDFAVAPISTDKNIRFVGAGAGTADAFDPTKDTRLRATSDTSITLRLTGPGGGLEKLRIDGFQGPDFGSAVLIDPPDGFASKTYELTDVTLTGSDLGENGLIISSSGGPSAANVTITGSRLVGGAGDDEAWAITYGGSGLQLSMTILDSVLTAAFTAIDASGDGSVAIRRSVVDAAESAIDADSHLTVDSSRIRGGELGIRLRNPLGTRSAVVRNSLVLTDMPRGFPAFTEAPIELLPSSTGQVNLDVIGSTLIGTGPVDGGIVVNSQGTSVARVDLRGSAVAATGTDLLAIGTGTESISASNSAFADSAGNAPAPGSGTNVGGDPLLGADFHPLGGSPLIDRSDPAFFSPGDLDLAGTARGSTPDIGAFEYVPPPGGPPGGPPGINVAPVVSSVSLSNRTFAPVKRGGRVTAAAAQRVKRGTKFRYTLSEAATVSVTVQRKLRGRRVGGRCVPQRRSNRTRRRCSYFKRAGVLRAAQGAGRRSLTFTGRFRGRALRPGSYRARIVARDAGGLKSKPRVLSFRVVRG